jgi:DNA-binding CsgD family transcriptional regulator
MDATKLRVCIAMSGGFAGLLILVDSAAIRPLLIDTLSSLQFFIAALASVIITSLFSAVCGALVGSTTSNQFSRFGGILASAGFFSAYLFSSSGIPGLPIVICGIVFGFGLSAAIVWQGTVLSTISKDDTLFVSSSACLVAACLKTVALFFSGPWYIALVSLFLVISSMSSEEESASAGDQTSQDESLADKASGMLSRNWMVFCSLLLCITVVATAYSPYLFTDFDEMNPRIESPLVSSMGFFIGSLVVLLSSKLFRNKIGFLYQILPLGCAASLLVAWLLGDFLGRGSTVDFLSYNLIVGFSLAACGILSLSRLSVEVRNGGLSPLFVFGLFTAVAAILFLSWPVVVPLLGETGTSSVDLTIKVAYLVAAFIQVAKMSQRQPMIKPSFAGDTNIPELCEKLSDQFALSKRESQFLYYLIQGRSSTYIAENHFISTNTVKSHIKRIYAKMGVHSKQELLDLFYQKQDE